MRYRPVAPPARSDLARLPSAPAGPVLAAAANGKVRLPAVHRDRLLLGLYAATVLLASLVHDPAQLGAGLVLALLLAGREAIAILARTLRAVLAFNLAVGVGYALFALVQGQSPWATLLLINLRVLLLTSLTFLFIRRVNLFQALGFSRTLSFLLGLAYSQALAFRRAYGDFQLALVSRSPRRPRLVDRYRASAAAAAWFMDKGLQAARDTAQALRARGFFDA
jgi:cobalt/nickel transport system permease protein